MKKNYLHFAQIFILLLTSCSNLNPSLKTNSREPSSVGTPEVILPVGEYSIPGGQGFWSDGNGGFCDVPEWDNYNLQHPSFLYKGTTVLIKNPTGFNASMVKTRCKVVFPIGNYHLPQGVNFYSSGTGNYCTYANWNDYLLSGVNSNIDLTTHISALPGNLGNMTVCSPNLAKGRYQLPNKDLFSSDGKGDYCTYSNLNAFIFLGGDKNLKNVTQITALPTGVELKKACEIPQMSMSATEWVLYNDLNGKGSACQVTIDSPVFPTSYKAPNGFGFHFAIVGVDQGKNGNYWVNGVLNSAGNGIVTWPKEDCAQSILTSAQNSNFNAFDGSVWIAGTYNNGKGLYAMIHTEYYGGDWGHHLPKTARCPSGIPYICWFNSVGAATWNGATQSFVRQGGAPNFVVAKPALAFNPNRAVGYWTNTNIVKSNEDDYYYMYLSLWSPIGNSICPTRTKDLSNPTSWRAWDGQDFTVDVHSGGNCVTTNSPLTPTYIGYNTYLKKYISVGYFGQSHGYSTSSDLIHWSAATSFSIPINNLARTTLNAYPSLVDFQALTQLGYPNSMSGALTGKNPTLVYIHFWPDGHRTAQVRQLTFNPSN